VVSNLIGCFLIHVTSPPWVQPRWMIQSTPGPLPWPLDKEDKNMYWAECIGSYVSAQKWHPYFSHIHRSRLSMAMPNFKWAQRSILRCAQEDTEPPGHPARSLPLSLLYKETRTGNQRWGIMGVVFEKINKRHNGALINPLLFKEALTTRLEFLTEMW
jgi:hypothetical protein